MEAVKVKNDLTVAAAAAEDMGDEMILCTDHPYRNNSGGVCAFCLQEKLGKLVSSSFPFPIPNPDSPSSSSPVSSTSDVGASARTGHLSKTSNPIDRVSGERRARIPFLLARRKKKDKLPVGHSSCGQPEAALKRSKSIAGFRCTEYDYSTRTRRGGGGGGGGVGFWSFLHLSTSSSSSSRSGASRKGDKTSSAMGGGDSTLTVFEEESPSVNGNQFPAPERKVLRSRSVGCGSRSFSGDFFERISTGFGDCTLRRVESLREGHNSERNPTRVQRIYNCGGIFGGLMLIGATSASSSDNDNHQNLHHHPSHVPGKPLAANKNGRSRGWSWNWALASPIRALAKPGRERKREISIVRDGSGKSAAPDLSTIPSQLVPY